MFSVGITDPNIRCALTPPILTTTLAVYDYKRIKKLKFTKMNEIAIEIEVLETLLEDIEGMHPEYIKQFIAEQLDVLKYGL